MRDLDAEWERRDCDPRSISQAVRNAARKLLRAID
jgi:hypothetical protein